jgi:hypothetical protein
VEQARARRVGAVGAGEAEDGVELVHLAVGGDARSSLGTREPSMRPVSPASPPLV